MWLARMLTAWHEPCMPRACCSSLNHTGVQRAWRLRACRLNASHRAAEKYIAQFPSPLLSHCARFVAFVAGSFAALLLFTALLDDDLLERHLFGRNLVWCAVGRALHPLFG